jgi:hypothetical protein
VTYPAYQLNVRAWGPYYIRSDDADIGVGDFCIVHKSNKGEVVVHKSETLDEAKRFMKLLQEE